MRDATVKDVRPGDRIDVYLRGHGRPLQGVTVLDVSQHDNDRYDWMTIWFVPSTLPSWMVSQGWVVIGKDRPVTIH